MEHHSSKKQTPATEPLFANANEALLRIWRISSVGRRIRGDSDVAGSCSYCINFFQRKMESRLLTATKSPIETYFGAQSYV